MIADTVDAVKESEEPPLRTVPEDENFVWRYRGYKMRPAEFNTAMVHYYRAEIQRSNTWRTRLDATTNWAVLAAGTAISFALSSPQNHYGVIILDTLLITVFLWIEARRYRYYELWSYRARLLETDFFAAMLVPPFAPHPEWAEAMAETLLQPEFPVSMWEAFGRRLRRNYLWIFMILGGAWALKCAIHPTLASSLPEFFARSDFGPIPGFWMFVFGALYLAGLTFIALVTVNLHQASGEVLPKFNTESPIQHLIHPADGEEHASLTSQMSSRRRRKQLVAQIITDQPEEIANQVMKEMKRGVTALDGKGMYTGKSHSVLLIALTVTETVHLKALIQQTDPNAFMIVMPAQEVLGRGFQPSGKSIRSTQPV
jgi:uncharacterized membrane protein